jgi:hypothetical protein
VVWKSSLCKLKGWSGRSTVLLMRRQKWAGSSPVPLPPPPLSRSAWPSAAATSAASAESMPTSSSCRKVTPCRAAAIGVRVGCPPKPSGLTQPRQRCQINARPSILRIATLQAECGRAETAAGKCHKGGHLAAAGSRRCSGADQFTITRKPRSTKQAAKEEPT